MSTPAKSIGIDVCSGPSLSRAERMAQVADRFAPRPATKSEPRAAQAEPPAPRPPAGE